MNSKVVKQGDSYAIHHLSDDGTVRAVRPTDRAVYRLWKVLQDQVDELHAKLKLADSEARKFRATTLELSAQNRIVRETAGAWAAVLPERVIGAIGGADWLAGPTPEAEQQRAVVTVLNELVAHYLKDGGTEAIQDLQVIGYRQAVREVRKILMEPNLATEIIEQLGLWTEGAEDAAKEVAKSPRNAPRN